MSVIRSEGHCPNTCRKADGGCNCITNPITERITIVTVNMAVAARGMPNNPFIIQDFDCLPTVNIITEKNQTPQNSKNPIKGMVYLT